MPPGPLGTYIYAAKELDPDAAPVFCHFTGFIPEDFNELVELSIQLIPTEDDADWGGQVDFAACQIGENFATPPHSFSQPYTWDLSIDEVFVQDLTPLVAFLAAGDMIGIGVISNVGNGTVLLVGVHLVYRIGFPQRGGLAEIREEFFTW